MPAWPFATIDFEASSLDQRSYPIEAGLAIWPAPDEPILGWSTLIRPLSDWTSHGHWSPASAKVHGIRGRDLVAHGQDPAAIAAALNSVIEVGSMAWCDGGPYDGHWMDALFKAGGVRPTFELGNWHRLVSTLGPLARERALAWLDHGPSIHRARADAEQLLCALRHGLGMQPGPSGDLADRFPVLAALTPAMRQK